jgi:hypothetical protein
MSSLLGTLVTVKSKTINNESVPVVFYTATVMQGGAKDERELSRSYIFKKFKAEIPLRLAKILVKQNPKEFSIIGTKAKYPSKRAKKAIKASKEKKQGFSCKHCKSKAKSKAGLMSHIRYNHPKEWAKNKEK